MSFAALPAAELSEEAVTARPPSELTSSIPPGADNVQHYITGIKYSRARYNQVNLCSETPHAARVMNGRLGNGSGKTDSHYAVKCDTWSFASLHTLPPVSPTDFDCPDRAAGGPDRWWCTHFAGGTAEDTLYFLLIRKSFEAE